MWIPQLFCKTYKLATCPDTSIWWALLSVLSVHVYIRSVHPSENVTIAAFWREPAGRKGECLFNECWMNVMLIWDLFPLLVLWLSVALLALHALSSQSLALLHQTGGKSDHDPQKRDCTYTFSFVGCGEWYHRSFYILFKYCAGEREDFREQFVTSGIVLGRIRNA